VADRKLTLYSMASASQPGRLIFKQVGGKKVSLDYDAATWKVSVEKLPLNQPDDKDFGRNGRFRIFFE
jgi:hypothetical protein